MPTLHFEHSLIPLLGSQQRQVAIMKNTDYQAPYLHIKNVAPHIPLTATGLCWAPKPNTALQPEQGCTWWCCHIPEDRTGPWRHLSLPLLHQPSCCCRRTKGPFQGQKWSLAGIWPAIPNPKILKIYFIMWLNIMEKKRSSRLVFFHATASSNTSNFL